MSKQRDLLFMLGAKNSDDIGERLDRLNINNWDDYFQLQKQNADKLTSYQTPLYKNQNEKIVDILHFIFSAKRVYKSNRGLNIVKAYIPTFILSANSSTFRELFVEQRMLENYSAITRNKLIVIIFTERELYKIYGDSGLSAFNTKFYDEESYEKQQLSEIVNRRIKDQENALRFNINGLNIDPAYLSNYNDNSTLMELIENGEFVLENTFIDKKNFLVDFVSQ